MKLAWDEVMAAGEHQQETSRRHQMQAWLLNLRLILQGRIESLKQEPSFFRFIQSRWKRSKYDGTRGVKHLEGYPVH